MKTLKQILSVLLIACLMFSLMTVALAEESEDTEEFNEADFFNAEDEDKMTVEETVANESAETIVLPTLDNSSFLTMVMLDCGRGYYTVSQVKNVISSMAANGYKALILGFGNDGMRFLLDDMSVTVGDTTYEGTTIKNAIITENAVLEQDDYTGEWTESDMAEIIAYANNCGLSVIPMLNTPGHATSIVKAMEACNIDDCYVDSSSAGTSSSDAENLSVNLLNETARDFAKALVSKYIAWFAAQGCTMFNLGCDEYGGNSHTITDEEKTAIVAYINDLCVTLGENNMVPFAFADVLSKCSGYSSNIVGINWNGTALTGNTNVNANSQWYYNLGREADTQGGYGQAIRTTASYSVLVPRGSTSEDSSFAGSILCIWDDANIQPTDDILTDITNLIVKQATSNTNYFAASYVTSFLRTVMIDCGRGYYSVEQIEQIIDKMSLCDYDYLMLGFGNDGFRLLLDDMSVTANGTTYNGTTISNAIIAKNDALAKEEGAKGQWSQSDMDTIISYAHSRGIAIIPMIDNPGHATSITAAMTACGINAALANRNSSSDTGSTTFDVTNTSAVNFAVALIQKYIDYFASKGCTYFNLGMDEYAGNNGGYSSMSTSERTALSNYLTTLCANLVSAGMTPLAFCDVIGNLSSVPSSMIGINWNGTGLSSHSNINANQNWYYVLGATGTTSTWAAYEKALYYTKNTAVTKTVSGTADAGCLLAVWNDNYLAADNYIENIKTLINTQASSNMGYFSVKTEKTITVDVNTETTDVISGGIYDVTIGPDTSVATVSTAAKEISGDVFSAVTSITSGNKYVISLNRSDSTESNTALTSTASGSQLKLSGTASESSEKWTFTSAGSGTYYVTNSAGKYLTISSGGAAVTSTKTALTVSYVSSAASWQLANGSYYLNQYGGSGCAVAGGWTSGASSDNGSRWALYTTTSGTVTETEVTFKGVSAGTTSATVGNVQYTITVNPVRHVHSYTAAVTTAPTCTTVGIRTYTCTCGDSYTESVPATGHKYTSVKTEATCTAKGSIVYTCADCGAAYTEEIPMLEHDYEITVIEPTCTEAGEKVTACAVCGEVSSREAIPALGHNYTSEKTEPTCTEEGKIVYTCSRCGTSYAQTILARSHDYTTMDNEGDITYICNSCGYSYEVLLPRVQVILKVGETSAAITMDGEQSIAYCGDESIASAGVTVNQDKTASVLSFKGLITGETYYVVNGTRYVITVTSVIGDYSGNGIVNLEDLLVLKKYLAGVEITIDHGADMNNDQTVNLKDLLTLKQMLANA